LAATSVVKMWIRWVFFRLARRELKKFIPAIGPETGNIHTPAIGEI
jgi:hypothetical protein